MFGGDQGVGAAVHGGVGVGVLVVVCDKAIKGPERVLGVLGEEPRAGGRWRMW